MHEYKTYMSISVDSKAGIYKTLQNTATPVQLLNSNYMVIITVNSFICYISTAEEKK